MLQRKNSEERVKEVQAVSAEFKRAFAKIDQDKNDSTGIFRDVKTGGGNLFDIKPFHKDSASDSIYFGVQSDDKQFFTQPRTAFVKAFVNASTGEDMRVETCMYKNNINDVMIQKLQTPNLVHYYGTLGGHPMGLYTSDDIYYRGRDAYKKVPKQTLNRKGKDRMVFNFTEYLPMTHSVSDFMSNDNLSMTFSDFLKARASNRGNITDQDLAQLLFQLVYTLWIFERNGVYHNDIHVSNILIVKNPMDREFIYDFEYSGVRYMQYMKPRFIAKIFDYDRGYDEKKKCYPVKKRDDYSPCYRTGKKDYTDCYSKDRKGYDFLRMLTSTYSLSNKDIETFFEKELNDVMKKFNSMKGVDKDTLQTTGVKSVDYYGYRLLVGNLYNGWFESASTKAEYVSILRKYPEAELYSWNIDAAEKIVGVNANPQVAPPVAPPVEPTYTKEQLEKMLVPELKDILKRKKMNVMGRKKDLVLRIMGAAGSKTKSKSKTVAQIIASKIVEKLYTKDDLDKMTVQELKELLLKAGLTYELNKNELIDRILKAGVKKVISKPLSQPRGSVQYVEDELRKKRVASLQEILKKKKLKVGGRKSQIIKRILENQEKILGPSPVSSL